MSSDNDRSPDRRLAERVGHIHTASLSMMRVKDFPFSRRQRLRTEEEFRRVYDGKVRAGDRVLLVFALENDLGITRCGLSVSRKLGGSVVRSRFKRLLREAFRLSQHELPAGLDLILIPRPDADATLNDFRESLVRLSRKLAGRLREDRP